MMLILQSLTTFVSLAWVIVGCGRFCLYIKLSLSQPLRMLTAELGILFYPWPLGIGFMFGMELWDQFNRGQAHLMWLNFLWLAVQLFVWRSLRDVDDDDRWKRRRRKATEAVKRVGARLIITPTTQGA